MSEAITTTTGAMKDVLAQLFLHGPVWDGNIASKSARDAMVQAGLAKHENGWAFLTSEGVAFALRFDASGWADKRFHRKQKTID